MRIRSSCSLLVTILADKCNYVMFRSLFELDLMKVNPERGFYRIVVSATSQQPSEVKLIGTSGAEVYNITRKNISVAKYL